MMCNQFEGWDDISKDFRIQIKKNFESATLMTFLKTDRFNIIIDKKFKIIIYLSFILSLFYSDVIFLTLNFNCE